MASSQRPVVVHEASSWLTWAALLLPMMAFAAGGMIFRKKGEPAGIWADLMVAYPLLVVIVSVFPPALRNASSGGEELMQFGTAPLSAWAIMM